MASFTDNIPKFNPYIQQLPVEAMVKVGVEKQKLYDEGITKIQTQIDNIAGLDVIRGIDKTVLQSKLNELGNNLKTVAAGDFSNFQLVNSVSGMTNQIVKDPTVQNAVGSTARYRKDLEKKEALEKEGKTSPSNDYIFNRDASEWFNSQDVNKSYTGSYTQYTNWKKNSLELLKSIIGDSTITDDAFKVNSKGELELADAIVRTKLGGKSPEKIQEALLNGLSPADFKQMQIDSVYNYANQDANKFKQTVNDSFNSNAQHFIDQKTLLENSKTTKQTEEQRQVINSKIESIDRYLTTLKKQQSSLVSMVDEGNVEGAKSTFGTYNSIAGFSRAFSNTEISKTYENSPLLQAQQYRETKEIEYRKFVETLAETRRHNISMEKKADKANKIAEEALGGYNGLPDAVDQTGLPKIDMNVLVGRIEQADKNSKNGEIAFLKQQGKDASWLNRQKELWEKNPNSVSPAVSQYLNMKTAAQRDIDSDKNMLVSINKEVAKQFKPITDLIPKGSNYLKLTAPSGTYIYSPEELVNFNTKYEKYISYNISSASGEMGGSAAAVTYDNALAKKELSAKEYRLFEQLNSKSKTNDAIRATLAKYQRDVNGPYQKTLNEINKFTINEIQKRTSANQGVSYEIPTTTTAQKESIANLMVRFADRADKQKGGMADSPNWNSETARKLGLNEKTKYSIVVVDESSAGGPVYEMRASGEAGSVSWRVSQQDKFAVFGNQRFESSPEIKMASPYLNQMTKMGGQTTAIDGEATTLNNAYLGNIDFTNVRGFGIKANLTQPFPGQYSFDMYVHNPLTGMWSDKLSYPASGLLSDKSIAPALGSLTDSYIYEMLYGRSATSNDLKKINQPK